MKNFKLILLLFLAAFAASCSKDNPSPTPNREITEEIKDIIYSKGDESADVVLVNTQGGPAPFLLTDDFNELLQKVNVATLLQVNVHQAQTYRPSIFKKDEITFAQAISYDAESIEMLYKVTQYFNNQGRTVYVLGISFGAFMVQELIAKKGIDVADKYLIMVGRLDMNEVFWKAFSEGKGGYFVNGITPMTVDQDDIVKKNMSKLAAGLGQNRYTQKLNQYDLSKVTYVYGETDEAVGRLTDAEIQFLQSKNASIIKAPGDHGGTIDDYLKQGFKQAFGIE